MIEKIPFLLMYLPMFLISLTVHEFCHAFVAFKKGDPTAKLMGRLTLNPIPHIDPIGTILLPVCSILFGGVYFGWAKPVPVNPMNLKDRVNGMFWVALAGPFSNFMLAFFAAWAQGMALSYGSGWFSPQTINMIQIIAIQMLRLNLALCFFNLIPLAPLDGSKIIGRFLPSDLRSAIENINPMVGGMILLALLVTGILEYIFIPIGWIGGFLIRLFIF